MCATAIEAALLAENQTRCVPPLPEEEVRRIAASVSRYAPCNGRAGGNGSTPPPDPDWGDEEPYDQARRDEAENSRIIAQERELPDEQPVSWPCPNILWQGKFLEVAQAVGVRSWEVWVGIYAALSAVAHRNLHWFYFNDPIFGMSYPLLLGPTGAGKNLVTNICQDLLPNGYPVFYSVQSGPGLIPLLADASLKNKEGRLIVRGRPVLLLAEEWSRTIQMAGIEHATLLEDLNALFQRNRPWSMSRSHKLSLGLRRALCPHGARPSPKNGCLPGNPRRF